MLAMSDREMTSDEYSQIVTDSLRLGGINLPAEDGSHDVLLPCALVGSATKEPVVWVTRLSFSGLTVLSDEPLATGPVVLRMGHLVPAVAGRSTPTPDNKQYTTELQVAFGQIAGQVARQV